MKIHWKRLCAVIYNAVICVYGKAGNNQLPPLVSVYQEYT